VGVEHLEGFLPPIAEGIYFIYGVGVIDDIGAGKVDQVVIIYILNGAETLTELVIKIIYIGATS